MESSLNQQEEYEKLLCLRVQNRGILQLINYWHGVIEPRSVSSTYAALLPNPLRSLFCFPCSITHRHPHTRMSSCHTMNYWFKVF